MLMMKTPAAELFQLQVTGHMEERLSSVLFSSNGVSASVEKTKPEGSFSEAENN